MTKVEVEIVKNKGTRIAIHFKILQGPYNRASDEDCIHWARELTETQIESAGMDGFEIVNARVVHIKEDD